MNWLCAFLNPSMSAGSYRNNVIAIRPFYQSTAIRPVNRSSHEFQRREYKVRRDIPRNSGVAFAAANEEGSNAGTKVNVVEYFILFQFTKDTDAYQVEKILSNLWSLKYIVPNVLCASAGAICTDEFFSETIRGFDAYTHAVKFRFGSPEAANSFQTHPKFVEVSSAVQAEIFCAAATELVAQVSVPNELQNIFKTGGTWETGVEHVLLMECENIPGTLASLSELAVSSTGGAMQSGIGSAVTLSTSGPGTEEVILVSHFPSATGAMGFMKSEAVMTLLASSERPRIFCFEIVPTDSKSRAADQGFLS